MRLESGKNGRIEAGRNLVFTLTGLQPQEKVTVTIHSKTVTLPQMKANAAGTLTVTWKIPANFAPGRHTVTAACEKSGTFTKTFTVLSPEKLARTGAAASLLPLLALFTLGAGTVLTRRGKEK